MRDQLECPHICELLANFSSNVVFLYSRVGWAYFTMACASIGDSDSFRGPDRH